MGSEEDTCPCGACVDRREFERVEVEIARLRSELAAERAKAEGLEFDLKMSRDLAKDLKRRLDDAFN